MGKVDEYAALLRSLDRVEPYLLEESRLPGPRGNIELAEAAARVVDWRVREGVATALQDLGDASFAWLYSELDPWVGGCPGSSSGRPRQRSASCAS